MDDIEKRSRCRSCGYLFSGAVWDEDPEEGATYDICPCCRCESGNQDFTLESTRSYREQWIKEGMKWRTHHSDEAPPPNWNPTEQMKNIPEEFR